MGKNKKSLVDTVAKSASIMVITSFLSSILGYIRDIVITSTFGMGIETDAYSASFTIPDMIYYCLVGGALSTAFIPVFRGYIAEEKNEEGCRMASTVYNIVAILAMFLCLLGEIFTPQIVNMTAQFEGPKFELTVLLTRIMFAQCFFMCLTGISQGVLQSYKHFTMPSVGAVLYNLTIIVVGYILGKLFNLGIMGFSIGVVCAAIVNFAVQIPVMRSFEFKYSFTLDLRHDGVKQFFKLLIPVLLGLSMNQLNLLANQYFGSGLEDSALTALKQAQRIMILPVSVFCSSIGLSIFPTMTEHFTKGEIDKYKEDLSSTFKTILFIAIPSTLGIIAIRTPLIRLMYLQGKFTEAGVQTIAKFLMFYSLGIIGYSSQQILNRGFYSIKDTKTPVKINMAVLLLNIVLSAIFVNLWKGPGLALAYATSGTVSMILLVVFLKKKVGDINGKSIWTSAIKTAIAALIMFVVVTIIAAVMGAAFDHSRKIYQLVEVCIELAIGVGVFAISAHLLKIEEMNALVAMIKNKFLNKIIGRFSKK